MIYSGESNGGAPEIQRIKTPLGLGLSLLSLLYATVDLFL